MDVAAKCPDRGIIFTTVPPLLYMCSPWKCEVCAHRHPLARLVLRQHSSSTPLDPRPRFARQRLLSEFSVREEPRPLNLRSLVGLTQRQFLHIVRRSDMDFRSSDTRRSLLTSSRP